MRKKLLTSFLVLFLLCATVLLIYCCNLFAITYKIHLKDDIQYKNELVKSSKNPDYTVDKLKSIMGPYEIEEFIKENDKNPEIYTPSEDNLKKGIFNANFHAHTTNSDGKLELTEYLDLAAEYANKIAPKPFYIAITDHNTVKSGKDVIDILEKNPEKYKNLKIALGLEVYSEMGPVFKILSDKIHIHLLALGINPYDEELNEVFKKIRGKDDKWNYTSRSFESAIKLMSKKGLIGIAHPARYIRYDNVCHYETYIDYLFLKYWLSAPNNLKYTEGYYQSYDVENPEIIEYIKKHSDIFKINKTGDIDNHGKSLFKKI